jgi:hypothetical protein
MPRTVQAAAQLMPSTHFSAITRSIMLRRSTLADLWPQVIALAATRLRKRLD